MSSQDDYLIDRSILLSQINLDKLSNKQLTKIKEMIK